MNMTKKINVNFSSLVGLKAELLRKQNEVNEVKLKTDSNTAPLQLNKKRSKKTVGEHTRKRNTKELIDTEDIVVHKKSKLMLEAKTRLYERLKKSKSNNDNFLVDFKNKLDESDEEFINESIDEEYPVEPEENWVEYQDCFGRTRKCLREDLPHMQKKDELIKHEIMKKNADEDNEKSEEQYPIQEKEPEIEIMRRKWEEQTKKLAEKVDIHYQDILFDEARAHGVGYYAFSQDEEERTKQQESLTNLRKETERKQRETKEIKDLKDRIEQNRLKAAMIRKRIRAGLPAEPTEEELAQENRLIDSANNINNTNTANDNESADKDKESEKEVDHNLIKDVKEITNDENKIKAFGELLGKKNHWHVMSQEEWVHKCRAQRISKFGPVYDNFTSVGFYSGFENIDKPLIEDNKELDTETHDSQKSTEKSSSNFQNYEDKDSINNDTIAKENNVQDDKNNLAKYNNEIDKISTDYEIPKNSTESTLNPTTNLPNLLPVQRQETVSYPISRLSTNYSHNTYGYGTCVPEQYKPLTNTNIFSCENIATSSVNSNNSSVTNKQEASSRNINEDSIMAGLKYLRERFEESHNK